MEIYQQLTEYWATLGWPIESCPRDSTKSEISYDPLRKCFAASFITRAAVSQPNGTFRTLLDHKQVYIHPSSCLFQKKGLDCIIYNELVMTSKQYMRDVLQVDREWMMELQPEIQRAREKQAIT